MTKHNLFLSAILLLSSFGFAATLLALIGNVTECQIQTPVVIATTFAMVVNGGLGLVMGMAMIAVRDIVKRGSNV